MNQKNDGSIKAIYSFQPGKKLERPLMGSKIVAGFPSPAQDYIEGKLDLNEHLITHAASTFFVRVDGYSMMGAGILPDDILIVDRALEAAHNRVIIAIVDGELTVKRLKIVGKDYYLMPENEEFPSIHIHEGINFELWGVVTYVIHKV
ncbi:MAG: translesion error-prone DNA polymerase V autoproteolytic subunit [Candidatus Cloacimonas sp.]|jgi:DNA polymerase V|nr:translesion error-prone DNA polymerase V autoproteolytic subunit [Candidatus Cloacimonas sp.]